MRSSSTIDRARRPHPAAGSAPERRRCAAFAPRRPGAAPRRAARERHHGAADRATLALLGAPRLRLAAHDVELPPARWTALLAYLGRCGGWVRREVLATLFWPDRDDQAALLNLRQTLQTIARSAAGVALEREPTRVRWTGACDTEGFDALVRAERWEAAVRTYGGPFLDGLDLSDVVGVHEWIEAERSGLQARWRSAALHVGRAALASGRWLEAVDQGERVLRADPYDDVAIRLMLEAMVAGGDVVAARRTYAATLVRFERELGVRPDDETLALARVLGIEAPGA